MKKTTFAAIIAVVLCATFAYAHDVPEFTDDVNMAQPGGPGYGIVDYNDYELHANFYDVGLYQWYTLVDFRATDDVLCLGTRKSGYNAPGLGKLAIHADFEETPGYTGPVGELMLVPSSHVDCSDVDGTAIPGEMTQWDPELYLFEI